ncbi:NADH:flavin oxidoreductase/NADH oxidase [Brevundimonas sp. PAMC22021]|uniref:NADH:flavin oxidoreductase/NADH oxidase n=1 Tax=Brevundimonas sp. PAMC22021 TaxID=2861285 RepID=UPI001C62ADE5|nr:NADH:flavin oxidoreductase/NADH oxidase [Brevundimonas sp. PAMC22021]QYF86140.1 NADH:flavin oxidoreductase/NADH oxidase [Brevundimonas sp. PAMC22021]
MSQLFSPVAMGPLQLKNRVAIAPMCQYSAVDGLPQPWHVQHIGRLAISGAGLTIIEATGVEPEGRITPDDTGLWNDEQEAAFARILADIRTYSDQPIGVQLAHAGRKASTHAPAKGGEALGPDEGAWETLAPSAIAFKDGWHTPKAMDEADMQRVTDAFVQAAQRADRAGFDVVELHAAHGYLLSEFLSPLSNQRTDEYGGSPENRMRFPMRVAQALRDAWPRTKALGVRFNGSDWVDGGIALEEVTAFGRALHEMGYDYLHLTSGGNAAKASIPGREPGYQLRFAEAVKQAVPEALVMAVGMIFDPQQAEEIVASGSADIVAIARAALDDPHWPHHAAAALHSDEDLPVQYFGASKGLWAGYRG